MTIPNNMDQAVAACRFYAEQVWEATRGLYAAYMVDTGDLNLLTIPAWSELTERQQLIFLLRFTPISESLDNAILVALGVRS